MTATMKQNIVKQLICDAGKLTAMAAYFKDNGDVSMGRLVDEIVDRMHASASIIEAHVKEDE